MFEPNINIGRLYFNGIGIRGIKLKIEIFVKNNFIFPVVLNSLYGNLFIIDRKIKLCSNEKAGEFFCYDGIKLERKENIIKLNIVIYWKALFLIIIPNIFFDLELEVDIEAQLKILFKKFNRHIDKRFNINLLKKIMNKE